MPFNYSLEIIHIADRVEKFRETFNGPHDGVLALNHNVLNARLKELAPDPANPTQTRVRLTLDDSPLGAPAPGPDQWDYELFLTHLDRDNKTRTMHMFNGPHDSQFQPAPGPLSFRLSHLEEDPLKRNAVRIALTFTES